eukprot:scaffold421695_cov71-Attheya_sp.AAC.1
MVVGGIAATVAWVIRAEEKWTCFVACLTTFASIGGLLGLSYFLGRSSSGKGNNETEETQGKSRPKSDTTSGNDNDLSAEEQPSQNTSTVSSSSQTIPPPPIRGGDTPAASSKSGSPVNNNSNTTAALGMSATNENESDNNWRCACEGGFLPPGLLKTFGGAEAVFRMSTGQCYHKQ